MERSVPLRAEPRVARRHVGIAFEIGLHLFAADGGQRAVDIRVKIVLGGGSFDPPKGGSGRRRSTRAFFDHLGQPVTGAGKPGHHRAEWNIENRRNRRNLRIGQVLNGDEQLDAMLVFGKRRERIEDRAVVEAMFLSGRRCECHFARILDGDMDAASRFLLYPIDREIM